MTYEKDKLLNSGQAFRILKELEKEPSYTKKLAEEWDKEVESIRNITRPMEKFGLIEKDPENSDGRTKYYRISYEGFVEFWKSELKDANELQKVPLELEHSQKREISKEVTQLEKVTVEALFGTPKRDLTLDEQKYREILIYNRALDEILSEELLEGYLRNYIQNKSEKTIERMLFIDIISDVVECNTLLERENLSKDQLSKIESKLTTISILATRRHEKDYDGDLENPLWASLKEVENI